MLNAFSIFIKCALFAVIVLILGNWIQWKGKTLSDQVKVQMAHAEHSEWGQGLQDWSKSIFDDIKTTLRSQNENKTRLNQSLPRQNSREEIDGKEKQKLRSLIGDLNSSKTY